MQQQLLQQMQQQQQASQECSVPIPAGVQPGGSFIVQHNGAQYRVTAPAPLPPDGVMVVRLPVGQQLPEGQRQQYEQMVQQQQMQQQQMQQHLMMLQQQQYQQQLLAAQQQQQQQQAGGQTQTEWVTRRDPNSGAMYYLNVRTGEARWAQ